MKHTTKRLLSTVLTLAMVMGMLPMVSIGASATEEEPLEVINLAEYLAGATLDSGTYYLEVSKTFTGTSSTRNGLKIKAGATVTILLPKGVTLTATGYAGSYTTGGGAGILLPSTSTLIVLGEGTLVATGGNAGSASRGGDGSRSIANDNVDGHYKSEYGENTVYFAGAGGSGGNGGGSASGGSYGVKGYDVSVGEDTNILSYTDALDVSKWAVSAMQWACGTGLINGVGDGSELAPDGHAARAQVATLLWRFHTNVAQNGI